MEDERAVSSDIGSEEDVEIGSGKRHKHNTRHSSQQKGVSSDSGNYSTSNGSDSDGSSDADGGATATAAADIADTATAADSNNAVTATDTTTTDSTRSKRRRSNVPLSTYLFQNSTSSTSIGGPSSPPPAKGLCSPNAVGGPSSAPPPPTKDVLPLDDVMKAVNGLTNMALAHEIALDENFKLEKFEPSENTIQRQVKDVMQRAFWDHLTEQLAQIPPVYTQAFVLLQEVRDQLLEVTLPQHSRIRDDVTDRLDLDLIKQQAVHGVLDFAEYSGYILSLMGKLCAPVRDEALRKLECERDVPTVFKGVVELLDLMKMDMANFHIQMIRPTIMKQIVEYERSKFKEFLRTQGDGDRGLELTRAWITENVRAVIKEHNNAKGATPLNLRAAGAQTPPTPGRASSLVGGQTQAPSSSGRSSSMVGGQTQAPPSSGRSSSMVGGQTQAPPTTSKSSSSLAGCESSQTLLASTAKASSLADDKSLTPPLQGLDPSLAPPIGILNDPLALRAFCNKALNSAYLQLLQWPEDKLLPETVCIDASRVMEQRDRLRQVSLLAGVMLITVSTTSSGHSSPLPPALQPELRAQLKRSLCPILDPAHTYSETLSVLPNLIEQAVATVNKFLSNVPLPPLDPATIASLRHQLNSLDKHSPQQQSNSTAHPHSKAAAAKTNSNSQSRHSISPPTSQQTTTTRSLNSQSQHSSTGSSHRVTSQSSSSVSQSQSSSSTGSSHRVPSQNSFSQSQHSSSRSTGSSPTPASQSQSTSSSTGSSHRVTSLLTSRLLGFIKEILNGTINPRTGLGAFPGPFIVMQEEVGRVTSSFLRLTSHNRQVFGNHYYDMVEATIRELNDLYYCTSTGGSSNTPIPGTGSSSSGSCNKSTGNGNNTGNENSTGIENTTTTTGTNKSSSIGTDSGTDCSSCKTTTIPVTSTSTCSSTTGDGGTAEENTNEGEEESTSASTGGVRWDSLDLD